MNAASNTAGNISAIINAVMRDATSEGKRQADLTVALYANEVTYTASVVLDIFRKSGKDKTEVIDTMLSDVSDEFKGVINRINVIRDKHRDERTKADAFTVDGLNRKARAARIMFERALKSVFWLRENGCRKIASNKIGTGALKASLPDKEDDGEFVNHLFTCNELASKGDALLRERLGKASRSGSARNPVASLADPTKALAAQLTSLAAAGKRLVPADANDDVEDGLNNILRELFIGTFYDGAVFDRNTFNEWLKEVNAYAAARPVTKDENGGKTKDAESKAA